MIELATALETSHAILDNNGNPVSFTKLIEHFSLAFNLPISIKTAFNERDYIDDFGMKNNGEWYPIKLKLTGNFAMLVKERIYGKNQTVEAVDANTTILSVEMQNKDDIVSFVLGFRDKCEVLEPEWLREEMKKISMQISGIY